jgi:uncharacterized protein YaaW (UPF0174 family)
MESWNPGELNAFFCCVRSSEKLEPPSSRAELVAAGINELFWAYNSRTLAETKRTSAQALGTGYNVLPDFLKACITQPPPVGKPYEYSKSLTYEFLLREACGKFDIKDAQRESASLLEIYLFETIIARMLVEMNAKQRHDFLTRRVQLDVMAAGFPTAGWAGPMTTLAALSAAQASGFGVYMGATTALGLASHAVGVTLPFAVYTGMASTIAFLIGPVGFLATAGWLAHVLTSPEWARIIRGLLHIIAMRAKYEVLNPPPVDQMRLLRIARSIWLSIRTFMDHLFAQAEIRGG